MKHRQYRDKVPCPDCWDSTQHMDGVCEDGEICYTCGGRAWITKTLDAQVTLQVLGAVVACTGLLAGIYYSTLILFLL